MSPYTHLTLKDRESILLGISTGKTLDTIAKEIGRSKSTVSREIARNGGWRSYSAGTAQDATGGFAWLTSRPWRLRNPHLFCTSHAIYKWRHWQSHIC